MKTIIAKAACGQVAYDYGFKKIFATSQLPVWEKKINSAIEGNTLLSTNLNPLSSDHSGMSTISNIVIQIIFGNCFVMLRILREAKHLTKNLLLL